MAKPDPSADVSLDTSKTSQTPAPPGAGAVATAGAPAPKAAVAKAPEKRPSLAATLERAYVEAARRGDHGLSGVLSEVAVAVVHLSQVIDRAQPKVPPQIAALLKAVREVL
jgi:hypothetical protein